MKDQCFPNGYTNKTVLGSTRQLGHQILRSSRAVQNSLSSTEHDGCFCTYEGTVSPGDNVNIRYPPIQAALQTFDQNYIETIARHLREEGLATVGLPGPVGPEGQTQMVSLTPRGIIQAEEWGRSDTASTQCIPWARVERNLTEMRKRLETATTEEQYQAVGLLCRET